VNQVTIPVYEPSLGAGELENVVSAVRSGWISSKGAFVNEFEEKFAEYCGRQYGVSTSSGTAALHLAVEVLEMKKGDEVIVPALTFIATANSVVYTGAKPTFVDSHEDYWCIDPEKIEISPETRAIIPVHLYGHPCDMGPIMDMAEDHSMYVIEDAAEAHGAEYKGKKVGSFGDISCFSFYGNKILTTGEGGMCLTDDDELYEKMRILRDHGMNPKRRYWHDVIGFNYRMTNLQAAVGVAQLGRLDETVEKKRQIARWYEHELIDSDIVSGIHPEMPWAKCVYWMYSIMIDDRDGLMKGLKEAGIDTRPFFYPIPTMPPHQADERYPVAEQLSARGVNLPSSTTITQEEVAYICRCIHQPHA
jgi:perosamine synthetase